MSKQLAHTFFINIFLVLRYKRIKNGLLPKKDKKASKQNFSFCHRITLVASHFRQSVNQLITCSETGWIANYVWNKVIHVYTVLIWFQKGTRT